MILSFFNILLLKNDNIIHNSIISRNNIKYVVYVHQLKNIINNNVFVEYCNKYILSYDEIQEYFNTKEEEYKDDDGQTIEQKKKLLASFNNHEEACNMLCGQGRARTQDLEYQSGAL